MVSAEPGRFFVPPTSASGVLGMAGLFLDTSGKHKVDWREVAALVEDAYRHVAPEGLVAELDSRSS